MTKAILPSEFAEYTQQLFGEERWQRYLNAFSEEIPVSIRLNPFKPSSISPEGEQVPWCSNA